MVSAGLLLSLAGCFGLSQREKRVREFDEVPIARVVSVSGIVQRRCVFSDEALVDHEVLLRDTGTDVVLARTRTAVDGSFTLRAPRGLDGKYALHIMELTTDLPNSELLNFTVRLSVPCDPNDTAGIVANFVGPDGSTGPDVSFGNSSQNPDGTQRQLQSPSERWSIQKSGTSR